ncbi:serine/threonine-protein kinase [Actinoplanes couchii]|uniref:Protein kinase domain-containing protein n=1 Tax=Actinoplanes couchii TaxID=403638 RepID=A0ABQ3XL51_9ACTN|nr:serine/threonine-protein kinase [Actinoplanes couchii]MDR6318402.1 serine/threonine protein kinase [Actinoplanes couchii]GID59232.1 hypothetical protein Aco03nite_076360 [Actinoplanes couchii]
MAIRALRPNDPRVLGGFQVLGLLGEGGMGAVYQARDRDGRTVAIKVIRPEYAAVPEFRARFRSEVERARQVPPFSTAAVLGADPDHSTPYLVVEYVDGPNLSEVIADHGPLTDGALHSVAVGVATALVAIHGAGVVHRDLKPANVLFALGSPKVIDFGIARALDADDGLTRTGQTVGTVAYMAPERLEGPLIGQATPAVDVFAWGAVVAYAANGRSPFPGDSPTAIAIRILTREPELGSLTGPLRAIVERTLAKNPAARPTAPELLDMLLASDSAPPTRPVVLPAPSPRRSGQHRKDRPGFPRLAAAVGAGVLTVALAAGTAIAMWPSPDKNPLPPAPSAPPPEPVMVINDPLIGPSLWAETTNSQSSCTFDGEFLIIKGRHGIMCTGPRKEFTGDQKTLISVESVVGELCARIYFRYHHTGEGSYVLEVCRNNLALASTTPNAPWTVLNEGRSVNLGAKSHRFSIEIEDEFAGVYMDGLRDPVLTAPLEEPALTSGTVEIAAGGHSSENSTIKLYGIEVWTAG